ncbi:hypothetical protein [Mucilaginibacter pedocola]|uniref:Uncharacterized protein n=1 Tax=Mucilaginibacter pedocola TaxID=1792845 RepID=A0A1S9PH48_9SPHI|nr:hypothetical protein [Mucilaginibacter pedocola]OOQ60294.1 hypothetical protein BC343_26440 [Mucilaginibacter pedocola]
MNDYKKKLGDLASKIKADPPRTPIQQVQPVDHPPEEAKEAEARFNNWIPRSLKRRLKAYAAQNDVSLKEITIKALEGFLEEKDGLSK